MDKERKETRGVGHWKRIRKTPAIALIPLLVLASLLVCGVTVVKVLARNAMSTATDEAYKLGIIFGNWFAGELASATLPLFSLVQFVGEIDSFKEIAAQIGAPDSEGSLPYMLDSNIRDVIEICAQTDLVARYQDIVSTMEQNAGVQNMSP